jgi:hypothetical protein
MSVDNSSPAALHVAWKDKVAKEEAQKNFDYLMGLCDKLREMSFYVSEDRQFTLEEAAQEIEGFARREYPK